ncbi:MAG: MATE family efflux transporter [Erysipelotrichaceae bacterium]
MEISTEKKAGALDLERDPIWKVFFYNAIPAMIGMLAMNSATILDGIFVGQFVGSEALAAINLSMPLFNVLYGLGVMIAVGGATLANIRKGEYKIKESNALFSLTMVLLLIVGGVASFAAVVFAPNIAIALGAQGTTIEMVAIYLQILGIFFVPFLASVALDMFLKNDGFTVSPILCQLSGAVANVVLDILFIAVLDMGILGAALATAVAYALPAIGMGYLIIKKSSWKFTQISWDLPLIGAMLFNGSSEFFSNIAVGISTLCFNTIIMRRLGTNGVAAYSVASYTAMITMALYWGSASAMMPGVSRNKGLENKERVLALRNLASVFVLFIGVIVTIALLMYGDIIIDWFIVGDPQTHALALLILRVQLFGFVIAGVNVIASSYYTAINQPKASMIIAMLRSLILLLPALFLLPIWFGDMGIWSSLVVAEWLCLLVVVWFFKRLVW